MQASNRLVVSLTSLTTLFNINTFQIIYIGIDRLDLYIYHLADYQGSLHDALTFIDNIKQNAWNILQINNVVQYLNTPLSSLPSYLPYADSQFQKI